ncbi:flagellar biosynthetic protein FliO [uncultured Bartonella sp.]|uniref:flagellar biosynthetic protein FliO n=1 Tax=uncultured Bartonella sp. TaxID=104108 RepID=UPI002602161E|nr:flagellar biosynthetic protein FliO [uncultured Bartonella sp.]
MHVWLENQIGQSAANIITSLVVLIIVVAAIVATISILRKFNGGTFVVGGKSRTPRLSVRDAAAVDRTRRLVLVRRDNVEHLIMIGGPTDLVIETNIQTAPPNTDQDSVRGLTSEINEPVKHGSTLREPTMAPSPLSVKEPSPLSDKATQPLPNNATRVAGELNSNERRHPIGSTKPASGFSAGVTNRNFNYIAPRLDVNASDDNVGLSQNIAPTQGEYREPTLPPRDTLSVDRFDSSQQNNPTSLPHDFMPDIKNEILTANTGMRREPSFNTPPLNKKPVKNIDNDLDLMFEEELKGAIRNDKNKL